MKHPATLRASALQRRHEGFGYGEILKEVGVAKSTLWRWLKAAGMVETQPQRLTELKRLAQHKAALLARARRLQRTHETIEQAKREIRPLSKGELLLVGAALYWAEGTKQKPHNVSQRVTFSNSDPAMVRLFLRWLREVCDVSLDRLTFELCIHESANHVDVAQRFWASALQLPAERFKVRFKRHNVSPHRRNIGEGYVGLMRITVKQSAQLNRRIAGWIEGLRQLSGESAKGKPGDFGSSYPGSSPGSPALLREPGIEMESFVIECDRTSTMWEALTN